MPPVVAWANDWVGIGTEVVSSEFMRATSAPTAAIVTTVYAAAMMTSERTSLFLLAFSIVIFRLSPMRRVVQAIRTRLTRSSKREPAESVAASCAVAASSAPKLLC